MIGDTRYLIIRRILENAGGTPLAGDLETDLLEKYLVIIGGTPSPGDHFNVLLRKIVIAKGGIPTPGDDEWDLLEKWLETLGECRACGDSIYDLWRKILEMEEAEEAVPPAPEIRVQQGAIEITDGQAGVIDFGSVVEDETGISIVFTVFNDGDADLTLGAVTVPTGYTLTEPLSGSILPAGSDTFTVRLDTETPGIKAGEISFSTNDADENPFNFPIAGTVMSALLNNLIAHWRLDEASGSRVDVHGAKNLTDNATVTQAVGMIDNAAQFTAANLEYLSRTSEADLQTGNINWTVAAWIYLDTLGAVRPIYAKDASGNREFTFYVDTDNSPYLFVFDAGGGVAGFVSGATLSATTWYFIRAWIESGNIKLQINDGVISSTALIGTPAVKTSELRIGADELGRYWNGRVDSVSFWKRSLSDGEWAQLYNAGVGLDYPFS